MRKSKNKSLNRDNGQTSILSAMNNLKALSESQRKKKEMLSKIVIEVHSSGSESGEDFLEKKITVKRKLSFCLPNDEKLKTEPHQHEQRDRCSTPSPTKDRKMITINKPDIFSTPINHVQLQDSFSSPLNISNIKGEEDSILINTITNSSSCEDLDTSSDTLIVDNTLNSSICRITTTSVSTISSSVSLNEHDESDKPNLVGIDFVKLDDTIINTSNLSTNNNSHVDSIEKIEDKTDRHSEDLISNLETSKPCPRSPNKKIPKQKFKKETKTMNITYLSALKDLFSCFETSAHFINLLSEEKSILKIFISNDMDENYQYMCLKLLTWKNKWYNIFKFCEKLNLNMKNQDVLKLYDWLEENHIVETDCGKEDLSSLLNVLDMNDIQEIHNKFKLKRATSKEDRIKNLLKFSNLQSTLISTKSSKDLLIKEVKQKMGKCIKLKQQFQDSFYNIYLLATFTNSAFTSIADFFTNILGLKMCFPSYKVEEYDVFRSRIEFLRFARARKFDDEYENAFLNKNNLDALEISEEIFEELVTLENIAEEENNYIDAPHLKRYSAKAVYIRTLSKAVTYLSTKHPLSVKKWLEYMIEKIKSHRIGEWYYHLTWIYMKYMQPPDYEYAAKLVIKALKEDKNYLSELQILNLKQRSEQIQGIKKYKIDQMLYDEITVLLPEPLEKFPNSTVDAQTLRGNEMGRKRSYVKNDDDGNKTFMSVENIALDFYTDKYGFTDGRHCEGAIIHALFALFFWDIIYYPDPPIPGTFLSKIQQIPLDMKTPYFYSNRKGLIDKRLKDISSEWTRNHIIEFLKDNYGKHSCEAGICRIDSVIADAESDYLLETLVDCIGREILSKIFERLVKNVGAYRSGMPDLLIWNVHEKTAKFVEVKGEGDRLRPNQELWLSYLISIGADIEVCHVHSIGSKRKKR